MIGIFGAGGCGRTLMPIARANFASDTIVFVDDDPTEKIINGHSCVDRETFLRSDPDGVVLAIADGTTRAKILAELNLPVLSVSAETAILMDDVQIGPGACISPLTIFTCNIKIGTCFHANIYSYIEHDCTVGDFVTLAPGAKINGNVTLGDFAYIGAGATVKQGVTIGSNAVIGMGAVVTKNVPDGCTVVGNPASPIKRKL